MYAALVNHVMLPSMLAFTRSRFQQLARDSAKRQYWPLDRLLGYQAERLRDAVRFAFENVPFYRDYYAAMAVDPRQIDDPREMLALPAVTKREVEANFPDRMVAGDIEDPDLRWQGSGGTMHRIMVINDFRKRDYERAASSLTFTADSAYRLGRRATFIPPDACSNLCGVEGLREASVFQHLVKIARENKWKDPSARSDLRGLVMNNWIECRTILEPFGPEGTHISDERLATYVASLRRTRPVLLKALPEYLRAIGRYIRESGDEPHRIPVIKPMGALMCPTVKQEVEAAFGSPVREDYGSSDLGPMAFDCHCRNGLHLLLDHYYFEFIHDGRPAEDGELATLLVTDLHNRAMPLIRYKIGDLVRVDRSPCPCGRSTPRITVEGRVGDAMVTQNRTVTARMACEFFYSQLGIDDFQLIERPRRFDLQYVSCGSGPDTEQVSRGFADLVGDERTLRFRKVSSILPEGSGKFRHVKSCSHEQLHDVPSATLAKQG